MRGRGYYNTEEMAQQSLIKRLKEQYFIEPNSGCWIWTGPTDGVGYGILHKRVKMASSRKGAHRLSYELHNNTEIPKGLEVHHTCNTRLCINPAHMKLLTKSQHRYVTDPSAHQRNKTHCKRGHSFSKENTYVGKKGNRVCRACRDDAMRKWYIKSKGFEG